MTTSKFAILTALAAISAFAQTPDCTRPFVDTAHVVKDELPIFGAVERFAPTGADVYVRILQGLNQPTLEKEVVAYAKSCPNWQDATGHRFKNNLIVFFVAVNERRVGIWYGLKWDAKLSGEWPAIQGSVVRPKLAEARWSEGVVEGLDAVRDKIQPGNGGWWIPATLGAMLLAIIAAAAVNRRNRRREDEYAEIRRKANFSTAGATDYKSSGYGKRKPEPDTPAEPWPSSNVILAKIQKDSYNAGPRTVNTPPTVVYVNPRTVYVPADTYNPYSDVLNPLNPLSPLSPLNTVNEENRELREEIREERHSHSSYTPPEPEPERHWSAPSYEAPSPSYEAPSYEAPSADSSPFDSGSGGDTGF